jgi:hypothetical protein
MRGSAPTRILTTSPAKRTRIGASNRTGHQHPNFNSGPFTTSSPWVLTTTFAQHGITQWTRYIPVSRFWPMQFVEAGWLLVLSALLIAATVWLARRRAA